jgi:3-hydroxybutyryl-CoA dehydrogenase
MGRGIATAAASCGLAVSIYDRDPAVVAAGSAEVVKRLTRARPSSDTTAGSGKGEDGHSLVRPAESIELAAATVDVVIEAVPELIEVKTPVLSEILRVCRDDALVATNTSTMSIAKLDAAVNYGTGRLVGLHFFNPAHRMRLVEVILQKHQSPHLRELCESFVRRLDKVPIFARDVPGFVTSRLGLTFGNEAMRMLEDGTASAEDIDKAMRFGYNHPMGPLELADLVGLDARLNNLRALHESSGDDRFRPPKILVDLVASGRLGRKSGLGFYSYGEEIEGVPLWDQIFDSQRAR